MLNRRIAAGACALCLAVPAAATAKDGYNGHVRHTVASVPAGDTKYDLPSQPPMHNTPVAPQAASQASASSSDDANGWQLAALGEAALLAVVAVGAVAATGRRGSAPRMGA
jgi:hypothetical protein